MSARQVRYINPPPSFEETGQKIRAPHEVLVDRWGTCLDLATTYAAALEQAGLNPVLVLCDGHAFCGHLLDDQQLPELVVRDSRMILNYVEAGLLIPVETTLVCDGTERVIRRGASGHPQLVDGGSTRELPNRRRRGTPSSSPAPRRHGGGGRPGRRSGASGAAAPASAAPAGPSLRSPPPRGGDRPRQDFPPRVARWRSSLLDLSFRNPLLNMRAGRTSLELHVPQGALGTLEDLLFEGRTFNLMPHDQLAEIHRARGARTAQDIDPTALRVLLEGGRRVRRVHRGQLLLSAARDPAPSPNSHRGNRREQPVRDARHPRVGGRGPPGARPAVPAPGDDHGASRPCVHAADRRWAPTPHRTSACWRNSALPTGSRFQSSATRRPTCRESTSRARCRRSAWRWSQPSCRSRSRRAPHVALLQFSTLQLWQDLSENWETFMQNPVVRHLVETPTDSFVDHAGTG